MFAFAKKFTFFSSLFLKFFLSTINSLTIDIKSKNRIEKFKKYLQGLLVTKEEKLQEGDLFVERKFQKNETPRYAPGTALSIV